MNFEQPSNGLYATVIGANQIQFSLDTTEDNINYPGLLSFSQDHLLVTVEDANDPTLKVTIDLNIDTTNPDNIRKNN
ncbi:hypothetical protein [Peribacillus loiseleuriae]|uniref:Uncharacterized protein n=1 Tax=Peribacillus loiseleuriae TaxID=1679170 RepID=A0A0K9GSH2_9BACI|nr:hypothetical protein [Peribacillus loiseleuriae]KMY49588.1 hypothetical protein AC625_08560 [Peribacillus loiseleuriae]